MDDENIKSKIKTGNLPHKQYVQIGRFESNFVLFETFVTEINRLISSIKSLYRENLQKQSARAVLKKRCSENMQQIYRRAPMLKCDFSKVAKKLY